MAAWLSAEGRWAAKDDRFTTPQVQAATTLASTARAANIDVVVRIEPDRHVWAFATHAFADALPWIMDRFNLGGSSP